MNNSLPISVVIPTYGREKVLIDTLHYLKELEPPAAEILVLDQTSEHEPDTLEQLHALDFAGTIRWLKLELPSIPQAMNRGLLEATQEIVIYFDDDIRPEPKLLLAHLSVHEKQDDVLVAGRVIQPWQEGKDFSADSHFHFACMTTAWINEFMGGNFSIRRKTAIDLGGFDENFVRVAYRFEAEFAHRFRASGRHIYFEPAACLHHLKVLNGGTRTYGDHLTTWRPDHAVGAYYYLLKTSKNLAGAGGFISRLLNAISTRHHLRHPWWIPLTLISEVFGMLWAIKLFMQGPKYVDRDILNIEETR